MSVVFQCPSCSSSFRVALEHAGQLVGCPSCKESVSIPADLDQTQPNDSGQTAQQIVNCPKCSGGFRVAAELKNTQVACPHCNATIAPSSSNKKTANADMFAPGHQPEPQPTKPPIKIRTGKKKKSRKAPVKISLPTPTVEKPPTSEIPTTEPPSQKPASLPTPSVSPKRKSKSPDVAPPQVKQNIKTPKKISNPKQQKPNVDASTSKPNPKQPVVDKPTTASTHDTEPREKPDPAKAPQKPIAHRLPPKFTAVDPDEVFTAAARVEEHKVILPDGEGGFQRIDSRVVHVERDGQKVQLYSAPKEKKEQRRFLQNILAILIGIGVLAIAFYLLLRW